MILGVLRIRGRRGISHKHNKTLDYLNLKTVNSFCLLSNTVQNIKKLNRLGNKICWGRLPFEYVENIIYLKGGVLGKQHVVFEKPDKTKNNEFEKYLSNKFTGYGHSIDGFKFYYRLQPPIQGYKGLCGQTDDIKFIGLLNRFFYETKKKKNQI